jgi:hypothetical protein
MRLGWPRVGERADSPLIKGDKEAPPVGLLFVPLQILCPRGCDSILHSVGKVTANQKKGKQCCHSKPGSSN